MYKIKPNVGFKDHRGVLLEYTTDKTWKQFNVISTKADVVRGNHYHKKTLELVYLIHGRINVRSVNVRSDKVTEFTVNKDEAFIIELYDSHAVKTLEDSEWLVLLSHPHNTESPDIFDFKVMEGK